MPSNCKNLIGITMGCPVGVGPEIIVKFLTSFKDDNNYFPIVIGVPDLFEKVALKLGINIKVISWQPGDPVTSGNIYVCCPDILKEQDRLELSKLSWGKPTVNTGRAMAVCIEHCVDLLKKGVFKAMVTAPITKSSLQNAGYDYPGHTEMLADLCGTDQFAMMMSGNRLKVTLVTIHEPLSKIPNIIDPATIFDLIERTGLSLKNDFGIKNPKIAVAGLNPHAGEGGIFGNEEQEIIEPAINMAKDKGWQVEGPFPPDTVFNKAYNGQYDVVVCMYHDQGLIPFKLVHFEDGVNVTIGLPIVRTSVDHGTAYDIAGQGIASPLSLASAYETAIEIAANRKNISFQEVN